MNFWNRSVQKMLDEIEENLTDSLTLDMLAEKLNYSSYYCTRQFHKYVGISLRNYIRLRKLSLSAIDLRDSNKRIINIAFKYGFSTQEAYSRSFTKEFGISPSKYRKMIHPLPLFIKRNTYNPSLLGIKNETQNKKTKDVSISIQVIPKHLFVGLKDIITDNYFDFWDRQENIYKRDCYKVSGLLESIKSFNGVVGGWFHQDNKKGYLFGVEIPCNDKSKLPAYLEKIIVPESLYVVFHYPVYNYNEEDTIASKQLNDTIEKWDPTYHGYEFNYSNNPIYQRHKPEQYGQAICLPIKEIKSDKSI